jgi:(p)ppGpp synthase/HD superfamily hydrolase
MGVSGNWAPIFMNTNLAVDHARAFQFCQSAHNSIDQKRKYSGKPYWEHPHQVATILMDAGVTDPDMIAAAYCHDVLEDVFPKNPVYSPYLIEKTFNKRVLGITQELTDEYTPEKYPTLNRDKRHALEAQRLGTVSLEAVLIKLADLIANTSDIVTADPGFALRYLPEKKRVLANLRPLSNNIPVIRPYVNSIKKLKSKPITQKRSFGLTWKQRENLWKTKTWQI